MTIKIEDLRVGDRVTLKQATVLSIESDGYMEIQIDGHVDENGDCEENCIYVSAIASIEPRPLKVGKARYKGLPRSECEVLAINEERVWVRNPNNSYETWPVRELENIGEDAP